MIRFWPSGSDELVPPPTITVDDDSYIGGVARCFVGLAIASAFAANALAAQVVNALSFDDGFVPSAPAAIVDDDAGWRPPTPAVVRFVVPAPFAFEQHDSAAGLYGIVDDDGAPVLPPAPAPPVIIPNPGAWWQDEIVPQSAGSIVDDDVAYLPRPWVDTRAPVQPFAFDTSEPATGLYGGLEDDARVLLVSRPTEYRGIDPNWPTDDISFPAAPLTVDDDAMPVLGARPVVWRASLVFAGDDFTIVLVASTPEYPSGYFTLDDIAPTFALDDPQATFTLRQDYPA